MQREFQRLLATLHADNRKLPLKEDANAKRQQVKRYLESVKSEVSPVSKGLFVLKLNKVGLIWVVCGLLQADIDAAIRKKKLLNDPKHIIFIKTMCRDATSDERQRQRFEAEIQKLSARLPASATIGSPAAAAAAATGTPQSASTSVSNAAATPSGATSGDHSPSKRSLTADPGRLSSAALAALRERNRKANREEIRRAEIEARRKSQTSSKVDPSARVRTTVKVLHDMRCVCVFFLSLCGSYLVCRVAQCPVFFFCFCRSEPARQTRIRPCRLKRRPMRPTVKQHNSKRLLQRA